MKTLLLILLLTTAAYSQEKPKFDATSALTNLGVVISTEVDIHLQKSNEKRLRICEGNKLYQNGDCTLNSKKARLTNYAILGVSDALQWVAPRKYKALFEVIRIGHIGAHGWGIVLNLRR